jgi:hypothetical protein
MIPESPFACTTRLNLSQLLIYKAANLGWRLILHLAPDTRPQEIKEQDHPRAYQRTSLDQ